MLEWGAGGVGGVEPCDVVVIEKTGSKMRAGVVVARESVWGGLETFYELCWVSVFRVWRAIARVGASHVEDGSGRQSNFLY